MNNANIQARKSANSIHPLAVRFYSVMGQDKHGNRHFISPMFATLAQAKAFSAFSKQQYPHVWIQEETGYFQKSEAIERQALLARIITDAPVRPKANAKRAKQQA